jgi:hypothetical protein
VRIVAETERRAVQLDQPTSLNRNRTSKREKKHQQQKQKKKKTKKPNKVLPKHKQTKKTNTEIK